MTFDLPLEQINGARLETLRADSVREDRQLEFLSDVTSFAKAAGGDLIFGIRDRREEGKSTGEIETTH